MHPGMLQLPGLISAGIRKDQPRLWALHLELLRQTPIPDAKFSSEAPGSSGVGWASRPPPAPRHPAGKNLPEPRGIPGAPGVCGKEPGGAEGPWGTELAVLGGLRQQKQQQERSSVRIQPEALLPVHPSGLFPIPSRRFLASSAGIGAVARRFWCLDRLRAAGCASPRVGLPGPAG